jgi:hypothetical protein
MGGNLLVSLMPARRNGAVGRGGGGLSLQEEQEAEEGGEGHRMRLAEPAAQLAGSAGR